MSCFLSVANGKDTQGPYLREIHITETGTFLHLVVQVQDVAIWMNKQGEIKKLETVSYRNVQERTLQIEDDYMQTPDPYNTYCTFFQGRLSQVDHYRVQYELFPLKQVPVYKLKGVGPKQDTLIQTVYGKRVREIGPITFSYRENRVERINFQELEWNKESQRLERFGNMRLLYRLATGRFYQIWNSTEEQENIDVRIVYSFEED